MKTLILSSAALAVVATGGIAVAQGGRMAPPSTKAEATAQAADRFARLDADKNGQVTLAEMTAAREARMERREARMAAKGKDMPDRPAREPRIGKRVDTDGDGQISLAEMTAQALERFDRMDANKDGAIDTAEREAQREKRKERRAARMGE
ncbi:EF-hand domain-containing protein [Sphingomonas gilva]|uniref:EF-hand domain-containing protein n=1 Tax=Sphingomonas gilva TaxID=2305907 RepID=A0A396RQL2_9SPHN|nr:EF-hand domain-containing protein [Sphingomonas gilva]RHW16573.1 EF-hand domain-containing protein [Sphingomonas gilva]